MRAKRIGLAIKKDVLGGQMRYQTVTEPRGCLGLGIPEKKSIPYCENFTKAALTAIEKPLWYCDFDQEMWDKSWSEPLKPNNLENNYDVWLFKGSFWKAPGRLPTADVMALIQAEEIREQASLDRARMITSGELPERSSSSRAPIPQDVQVFVWQRDRGCCVQCGSSEKLEFDHIIPVSRGGSNTARNLQLLCEQCNRAKSNKIGSAL